MPFARCLLKRLNRTEEKFSNTVTQFQSGTESWAKVYVCLVYVKVDHAASLVSCLIFSFNFSVLSFDEIKTNIKANQNVSNVAERLRDVACHLSSAPEGGHYGAHSHQHSAAADLMQSGIIHPACVPLSDITPPGHSVPWPRGFLQIVLVTYRNVRQFLGVIEGTKDAKIVKTRA